MYTQIDRDRWTEKERRRRRRMEGKIPDSQNPHSLLLVRLDSSHF